MKSDNKTPSSIITKHKNLFVFGGGVILFVILAFLLVLILRSSDNTKDKLPTSPIASSQLGSPLAADINQEGEIFKRIGLTVVSDCDAVLNYYKENALKEVTAWGLGGSRWYGDPEILPVSADASETASDGGGGSTKQDFSSTNVQVEGVGEADIVKTDGKYIYLIHDRKLKIIDVTQTSEDNRPRSIAEVDLEDVSVGEMLLSIAPENMDDLSDAIILISYSYGYNRSRLIQINIDDRKSPKITADFTIDGRYVGARLGNNKVRLVTTSQPLGFNWESPRGSGLRAEADALEANKEIIRNSTLTNWMPAYRNNLDKDAEIAPLTDCSQMLIPRIFSGLNTLSVTNFDASKELNINTWRSISLAATGQEIYATNRHVYVATTEWQEDSESQMTTIHKFGTLLAVNQSNNGQTTMERPIYMATGEVEGSLLDQFSMDEYQDDLRVAVTLDNKDVSENHVKILRSNEGILEKIGEIAGLGKNERIYAVRFMEDKGYVVTFRQIDPLYTLDLSDPTNPRTLGELKIPGFSSYLHPVGNNLLLGIGQEADLDGRTQGLQLSLFDISNSAKPQRIDQILVANEVLPPIIDIDNSQLLTTYSNSPVEKDHRAFTFHNQQAFIPYYITIPYEYRQITDIYAVSGILRIDIEDRQISIDKNFIARKQDNKYHLNPSRTIIVGDIVYGLGGYNAYLISWNSDGKLLHILDGTNE